MNDTYIRLSLKSWEQLLRTARESGSAVTALMEQLFAVGLENGEALRRMLDVREEVHNRLADSKFRTPKWLEYVEMQQDVDSILTQLRMRDCVVFVDDREDLIVGGVKRKAKKRREA